MTSQQSYKCCCFARLQKGLAEKEIKAYEFIKSKHTGN